MINRREKWTTMEGEKNSEIIWKLKFFFGVFEKTGGQTEGTAPQPGIE